ncbi:CDP-glycerol glycerophosphotransferase family protein [Microbacter sp. GSS18]|nr:CDP-glycerol glycerophosphotransferase family protein [Microbacter sp. GSS18]
MASFSFGAGNARQLAALPLQLAGRLATALIPRSRDQWVFGCAVGIADGALALWRVADGEGVPAVWLVASVRERAEAERLGIPAVARDSLRGWWRTARARVVVVTHGFGDANRYGVWGAFVVQLWHGIPLKRIGLDSPATLRLPAALQRMLGPERAAALVRVMYRSSARRIRLLPAASHLVRGRLESAFGLADSRVPVTGEPRVDVLSQGGAAERRDEARAGVEAAVGPLGEGTRVVLYAPTWRDGDADPAVPHAGEWREIEEMLERRDAVLLVRSHPLGAGDYRPPAPTGRIREIGSDAVPDITPLLPALDALVTDYSSIVFDAALVPVPAVFLAPDEAEYARTRGFYGAYGDVAEQVATTWTDTCAQLDAVLGDADEHARRIERARRLSARVHAYRDGGSARRVYGAIQARLSTGRRMGDT